MNTSSAWPAGYACVEFDVIDSTNEEARRRAAAGERGPLWIFAGRQTAGRGRRARAWESPAGNLSATLLLAPERPTRECAQLSFVAALAVSDIIAGCAPNADIRVKWPNDVLADGRKIAGILLESASGTSDRIEWLAVGVGINLAHHPDNTEFPAISLAAMGVPPVTPRDAGTRLAGAWHHWYTRWKEGGFTAIRDAWMARAARLGERIRARLSAGEAIGIFEGIDETGALVLREAQRIRTIAAGEVYF